MFRVSRSFSRLQALPRRPALTAGTRPQSIIVFRQPHQALVPTSLVQRVGFASKKDDKADPPPPKQPIDYERERELGQKKLEARPSEVSTKSSTTNELKTPIENTAGDAILQNELKHDMGIIKETFSLDNVPHESKVLGLAGTIPYFATSLSTIYLSWDLKQTVPTGNSLYDAIAIDHGTAQYLLSVVEPVQLGYGAVIISFLGAIHWGLEYAEKKPHPERTKFRYGMGLIAPIVAWPTLIMPVPYALTTQFLAFVGLYFADARATTRGWAPTWYGSYRFMLTAIVGVTLFISLVGRQKMTQGNALTQEGLKDRLEQTGNADHETDWAKLEEEERERRRKEKAEAEKKAKKEAAEKKKKGKDSKKSKDGKSDEGKASDSKKDDKEEDDSKDDKEEDNEDDKADEKDDGEDKDNSEGDEESDKEDEKDDKKDDKKTDKKDAKKDDKKEEKKEDTKGDKKADKKDNKKDNKEGDEDGENSENSGKDEQEGDEAKDDEEGKADDDSDDKKGKDEGEKKDDKKSDKKSGGDKGKKK